MISEQHIFDTIGQWISDFKATSELQTIAGGNLNYVWRLNGQDRNLIIKWAPSHIAANPEVQLSPKRLDFEARALDLFAVGNLLDSLASEKLRPPRLLHFDSKKHLIIMEDVGQLPSIDLWFRKSGNPKIGKALGRFIGSLHKTTVGHPQLNQQFRNIDIQQTRQKVQYNPAADYLKKTGADTVDSSLVSKKTKALGQQLLEPGRCLVMGDLWPSSLLVDAGKLRLIDWEFAHFGRPLQDVGHFAAHCWMQSQADSSPIFEELWEQFWAAYKQELTDFTNALLTDDELDGMATHAGAEILVRAAGPFKEGYVYESFAAEHPVIQEAGQKAEQLISGNDISVLWQ